MSLFNSAVVDLVVPATETDSNALSADSDYGDATSITLFSPAGLAETGVIEVSYDGGTNWSQLETTDGSGSASIPAADKARVYFDLPAVPRFRIHFTGAAAEERTFKLFKQVQSY